MHGTCLVKRGKMLRARNLLVSITTVVFLVSMPYILYSGPESEAATMEADAVINAMIINASQQEMLDFIGTMDLAAIAALAEAHPNDAIPQGELLPHLPQPLAGWAWMIPGGQYSSNGTYTYGAGMYVKGTIPAITDLLSLGIHHNVGGIEYNTEAEPPEGVIEFDEGYPRETSIQGFIAYEWRATGDKVGEMAGVPGSVESIGGIWVGLGLEMPETGLLVLAIPLVLTWNLRKRHYA